MKIVCDNCGAKYSIADEKVKGKVFRIRCKKCSNSIVVRGESQPAAEPVAPAAASMPPMTPPETSQVDDAATRVFDYSGYQGGGDAAVWHVSMDGEQQGPYTKAQVEEFLAAGNINHDTYVWRDGLDDWVTMRDCSEFASPAPQAEPAAAAPAAEPIAEPAATSPEPVAAVAAVAAPAAAAAGSLFDAGADAAPAATGGGLFDAGATAAPAEAEASPFDSGGGLFAGGDQTSAPEGGGLFAGGDAASDDDGLFASSGVNANAGNADLFGGGAPAEGGDMFAAGGTAAPSPRVDADQAMLTGQRNENSVLFSLSNLQALASGPTPDVAPAPVGDLPQMGAPARAPGMAGDDASGLIDIRALASSLQSAEKEAADDGLLNIGGGGFAPSLGAPVLAASRTGISKTLLISLIGGGVALLAIIVVVVTMMLTPKTDNVPSATEIALADKLARLEELLAKGGDVAEAAAIKQQIETLEQKKEEEQAAAVATAEPSSGDSKASSRKSSSSSTKSSSKSSSTKKSTSSSTKKSSGTKRTAKKTGSTSELDDLLGGGAPKKAAPKKKTTTTKASSGGDTPQSLSKKDVKKGLNAVAGKVKACAKGQTGTLKLKIVIANSGRVKSANPTGSFAGTPAGLCAARAVRAARFPRFQKSSLSVTYPFRL